MEGTTARYGFGIFGTGMVRLSQDAAGWRICRFPAAGEVGAPAIVPELPSDSAAAAWKAAVDSGLLHLPRVPNRGKTTVAVEDGHSYVLESYDGRKYRVAEADNPNVFQSADDRRLESVAAAVVKRWRLSRISRCDSD